MLGSVGLWDYLCNGKGTSIHERIMTVLATWSQQGLNSLQMMRALNTYPKLKTADPTRRAFLTRKLFTKV